MSSIHRMPCKIVSQFQQQLQKKYYICNRTAHNATALTAQTLLLFSSSLYIAHDRSSLTVVHRTSARSTLIANHYNTANSGNNILLLRLLVKYSWQSIHERLCCLSATCYLKRENVVKKSVKNNIMPKRPCTEPHSANSVLYSKILLVFALN
jgi:hypothetical protein